MGITVDYHNIPDWLPFACLITGRIPVKRKPMLTKIAEMIMVAAIGGAFSGYLSLKVLEAKFEQYTQMDVQRYEEINRKLAEIDRCLRERTCTK